MLPQHKDLDIFITYTISEELVGGKLRVIKRLKRSNWPETCQNLMKTRQNQKKRVIRKIIKTPQSYIVMFSTSRICSIRTKLTSSNTEINDTLCRFHALLGFVKFSEISQLHRCWLFFNQFTSN